MEERQEIVTENIPNLIKSLTNFDENDQNFKLCEQFAWSIIRNHRNLSVNSHEVKRNFNAMCEGFLVGNYPRHAEHLQNLYSKFINHPLCLTHYETDVQWSILDFLLTLSYNPVGSLRKNKSRLPLRSIENESESTENDMEYWANLLREDWIVEDRNAEDSDLSEWSDTSSHEDSGCKNDSTEDLTLEQSLEQRRIKNLASNLNISSPKKEPHFKEFDGNASTEWLHENIQNTWWQDPEFNCEVKSIHESANFCQLWNQYILDPSKDLVKGKYISTVSEYCLLREIIWMFDSPCDCKFFRLEGDDVLVNDNVSLSSTTPRGLKIFLESFIPYMKMLNTMKKFIRGVYDNHENERLSRTYECYANGLQQLLEPVYEAVIKQEEQIKAQKCGEIHTILQLKGDLKEQFQYIRCLYDIHMSVILDYKQNPTHICAAYLLSSLLLYIRNSGSVQTTNLAGALFLTTVQTFCEIIDIWWTEGRLDDWQNEFLVERKLPETDDYNVPEITARLYQKCKSESFFVAANISTVIQEDSLIKLLLQHSLQAGSTLTLLFEIDKIKELKNAAKFDDCFYKSFIKAFLADVGNFEKPSDNVSQAIVKVPENSLTNDEKTLSTFTESLFSFEDDFLMMAFGHNLNNEGKSLLSHENTKTTNAEVAEINALQIYEKLNTVSDLILPLENIITDSISLLVQTRMSFANSFVTKMFRKEFEVLKHFQNIRKILLLEASDIMHSFYTKFFAQIEAGGKLWANPFILTAQLDDVICCRFPDMASMFSIEIVSNYKCQTTKVLDAVDEIFINYNVKRELRNIITVDSIKQYNKVFRFLLKVKWGLWTLGNLRFPQKLRTRPPYASMKMIDFLMRRLAQLRFWMIYALQCIHSHLITYVLQSMGEQLDEKVEKCTNLTEIKSVHESYINTVCEHCFLLDSYGDLKSGVEQLLNLIYILRFEWNSCVKSIANDEDDDVVDGEDEKNENSGNFLTSTQIEAIESTYIRCHEYLVNMLTQEVYTKQNSYLSGLNEAFTNSMPY